MENDSTTDTLEGTAPAVAASGPDFDKLDALAETAHAAATEEALRAAEDAARAAAIPEKKKRVRRTKAQLAEARAAGEGRTYNATTAASAPAAPSGAVLDGPAPFVMPSEEEIALWRPIARPICRHTPLIVAKVAGASDPTSYAMLPEEIAEAERGVAVVLAYYFGKAVASGPWGVLVASLIPYALRQGAGALFSDGAAPSLSSGMEHAQP